MFIHVEKERIKIIDSLRSFSLLGILLANAVIYPALTGSNTSTSKFGESIVQL